MAGEGLSLTAALPNIAIFLISVVGAFYANKLRELLGESELASVWKYVGLAAVLLFVGAGLGGLAALVTGNVASGQSVFVWILILAAGALTYGIYLQAQKAK